MQEEHLTLSAGKLRSELLPVLRGSVFHVTTPEGFQSICEDGAIHHNRDGSHPSTYPQSENSFFRNQGCVSVWDLRTATDAEVERGIRNYNFLNPSWADNAPVFLILKPSIHGGLVPWTEYTRGKPEKNIVVPHIEAGHPGDLPLRSVGRALLVEVGP